MGFNRRTFLHQTALSLLTLGISQSGLIRSAQSLAATTSRKLALLVGINHYGEGNSGLQGCVTDVERQKELLIYRFGFNPTDIVTLTDQQATREGIETAFLEHLIQQAQSGDVVVFHFSGYGNQIKLGEQEMNSFLPSNGLLNKKPVAQEILEETILLLGRSLATDQLTMVLDTSHLIASKPLQGNLRVRSLSLASSEINPEELSLQNRLKTQKKRPLIPGMIFSASGQNQVATEIIGHGWSGGLFTYALTQYLWQVTPASQIYVTLNQTSESVEHFTGLQQQPQLLKTGKVSRLTYYLMPSEIIGAEGVITQLTSEKTPEIRLTGIPASLVDDYGLLSCLVVTPSSGLEKDFPSPEAEILQITARQGLVAKTQRLSGTSALETGQTVQEWIRVLPRQIGLSIALDSSLSRIERVDATSALATLSLNPTIVTNGEQQADCILSKTVTESNPISPTANSANVALEMGKYQLLWVSGTPIPSSVGLANEAVKSAVQRLLPSFKTLLAAKLWRLTRNEGSSRLLVGGKLDRLAPTPQTLLRRESRLTNYIKCANKSMIDVAKLSACPQGLSSTLLTESANSTTEPLEQVPKIAIGTEIQYRLNNYGQDPIYCLLMGMDANGNSFTLSLSHTEEGTPSGRLGQLQDNIIAPEQMFVLPQMGLPSWRVAGPMGLTEIYIICSRSPFEKTLKALETAQVFNHERNPIFTLSQPLEVAQALLEDLHQASAVKSERLNNSSESYALDVNAWATLTFIYQVVG